MNIIFLGGIFSKGNKSDILLKSKGGMQFAADTLQKNYIEGLSKNKKVDSISVINLPFIGAYPKRYKNILFLPANKTEHLGRVTIKNTPFLNLIFLKNLHRLFLSAKLIISETKKLNNSKTILLCYSMHLPFLLGCYFAKLVKKDIHLCIIAPDLPEYMADRKGVSKFVFSLLSRISYITASKFDSVVVITKHMSNKFPNKLNKVLIEGIADPQYTSTADITERKKYFLYSGTLDQRYGIRHLINSYIASNLKDYKLYICGDGDDRDYIENAISNGANIKYLGQLDREKVLTLQKNATLLINPRDNESEYTKYSFPSKIIEYMSSGVPVLMYWLDGIPDEYHQYCYLIPPGPDGLKNKLIELSLLSEKELFKTGISAKKFIVENKLPELQVEKLLKSISEAKNV